MEALGTYKNVLRISPPLNIEDEKIAKSMGIVEAPEARRKGEIRVIGASISATAFLDFGEKTEYTDAQQASI
jgi:hypothetical protein